MKTKFYWHIHHYVLCEPLTEPLKNRIDYIKLNKPKHEIETRLRLLKPVKGNLPACFVKAGKECAKAEEEYVKAGKEYDKARKECTKAWEEYDKAREEFDKAGKECAKAGKEFVKAREEFVKAREEFDKAGKECAKAGKEFVKAREEFDKAGKECTKAWEEYVKAEEECKDKIEAVHRRECPNCPWDGNTIFPEAKA